MWSDWGGKECESRPASHKTASWHRPSPAGHSTASDILRLLDMSSGYPPFAVWSDYDHSSAVIIATTLCLFYWLALGIIQQGIVLAHSTRLSWPDGIFPLSMVCELRLFLDVHELTKHQVVGIVQSALFVVCVPLWLWQICDAPAARQNSTGEKGTFTAADLHAQPWSNVRWHRAVLLSEQSALYPRPRAHQVFCFPIHRQINSQQLRLFATSISPTQIHLLWNISPYSCMDHCFDRRFGFALPLWRYVHGNGNALPRVQSTRHRC